MRSVNAVALFLGSAVIVSLFAAAVAILLPGISLAARPYLQGVILGGGLGSVGFLLLERVRGGRIVLLVSIVGLSGATLHPHFQPLTYDDSLGPMVTGIVVGIFFMLMSGPTTRREAPDQA